MKNNTPKENTIRIKTKFAFIPVVINNDTRWLEKVTIAQLYKTFGDKRSWWNAAFVDTQEERDFWGQSIPEHDYDITEIFKNENGH